MNIGELAICRPGVVDYGTALSWQNALAGRVVADPRRGYLLLLEHPPVVTLGGRGKTEHMLLDAAELAVRGVQVHRVKRGGDATWHGPGQIVGYPILSMECFSGEIKKYVAALQNVLISVLKEEYGVDAEARGGKETGVWTAGKKIAAIGIQVSRRTVMHGFAFNVAPSMEGFGWINPCGLGVGTATSLEEQLGSKPDLKAAFGRTEEHFLRVFKPEKAKRVSRGELFGDEEPFGNGDLPAH